LKRVCRVDRNGRRRGACLAQEYGETRYGVVRLYRVMYRRRLAQRDQWISFIKRNLQAWMFCCLLLVQHTWASINTAPKYQTRSPKAEPNNHGNTNKRDVTKFSTAKSSETISKRHPRIRQVSAPVGMYARLIRSKMSTREVLAVRLTMRRAAPLSPISLASFDMVLVHVSAR
jgi:hypothetical protein